MTHIQNRRAKMKRDLEEQRRDIETAQLMNIQKLSLEFFQALTQMKTTAIEQPDCETSTLKSEACDDNEEVDVETTGDSE